MGCEHPNVKRELKKQAYLVFAVRSKATTLRKLAVTKCAIEISVLSVASASKRIRFTNETERGGARNERSSATK
jgi:hypothetical protein